MTGLYGQPLIIETPLALDEVRERLRHLAAARTSIGMPRSRRWRQMLGWKLNERSEGDGFTLQPSYPTDRNTVRFVGTIEASGAGSRIVGRVVHTWFTRIVMSIFMIFVAVAMVAGLAQQNDPPIKVLLIAIAMIGACVLMVRFELRSTAALIDAGLREATGGHTPLDVAH